LEFEAWDAGIFYLDEVLITLEETPPLLAASPRDMPTPPEPLIAEELF
jgi:hypothetical protein